LNTFVAVSQTKQDSLVYPFQDYEHCYTGLLNELGDTIWPAVFDFAAWDGFDPSFWMVQKDGYVGILDAFGKMVIEPELDHVYFNEDANAIIAMKDGKLGAIDSNFNWVLEPIYDSLIHNYRLGSDFDDRYVFFLYGFQGKLGLMRNNFEKITEPVYDSIGYFKRPIYNSEDYGDSTMFFVLQDEKIGLIDIKGNLLLEPQYKTINPIAKKPRQRKSELIYIVSNTLNQKALLDESFDLQVPFCKELGFSSNYYNYSRRNCSNAKHLQVFAHWEDSVKVFDLINKKVSKVYDKVAPFDNYVLFQKQGKWGVLDSSLNEIYSGGEGLPSTWNGQISTSPWLEEGTSVVNSGWSYYANDLGQPICPESGFIWECEQEESEYRGYLLSALNQRVVNFRTGKRLPEKHYRIYLRKKEGKTFFWGVDFENERLNFTIYDSNFNHLSSHKRIRSIAANRSAEDHLKYQFSLAENVIYQDTNDCFGLLENDGNIALEAKYNRISANDYYRDKEGDVRSLYKTESDSLFSLIDDQGKILIESGARIQQYEEGWYVNNPPSGKFYDNQFNLIFDKIQLRGRFGSRKNDLEILDNPVPIYFVNDGNLYMNLEGKYVLINKKNVPFEKDVRSIQNLVLLHKSGRVLFAVPNFMYPLIGETSLGFTAMSKERITFFSPSGKLRYNYESVKNYTKKYVNVRVEFEDGSWSVVDYLTGEERIKRTDKFKIIEACASNQQNSNLVYFAQNDNDKWHWINGQNEKVTTYVFDVKCRWLGDNFLLGRVNNKYAIFRLDGTQLTPFTVENVQRINLNAVIYKSNGKWKVAPKKDTINNLWFESCHLRRGERNFIVVFRNDSVAMLDEDFSLIQDFRAISDVENDTVPYDLKFQRLYDPTIFTSNYAQLHNQTLFRNYRLNLLSDRKFTSVEAYEKLKKERTFVPVETKGVRLTGTAADRWFTIYNSYRITKEQGGYNEIIVYEQYQFKDGAFDTLYLSELFNEPNDFDATLDRLLTEVIEREQIYGISCTNLPEVLLALKAKMIFTSKGLKFITGQHVDLVLSWETLHPFLTKDSQKSIDQLQLN
jgi:hypothetical protein